MKIILTVFLFVCVVFSAGSATAETQYGESKIYESMTMDKLSQLYWSLKRLDIDNDLHIDNFMMINECEIYEEYISNEFEWGDIREAARAYIKKNMGGFPLRFEVIQKIRLGKYDLEKEAFNVIEEDKIDGMRRFYINALDAGNPICGSTKQIFGYPKGVVLEISRPFDFTSFPLEKEKAKEFIVKNLNNLGSDKSKGNSYRNRVIYLAFKTKVFAGQGNYYNRDRKALANILAVLESVEVYGDLERTQLLFSKQFRARANTDSKPKTALQFDE